MYKVRFQVYGSPECYEKVFNTRDAYEKWFMEVGVHLCSLSSVRQYH